MNTKVQINLEKRKFIGRKEALEIFKNYYSDIFEAYNIAIEAYNQEIAMTESVEVRNKLSSTLMYCKMADSFISAFPENWSIGKYKRVIFRYDNVLMIIKKLNSNNKPSYIPTILSNSILEQTQSSLFEEDEYAKELPVLIFGYTKQKDGSFSDPRIVYFDEDVKWIIATQDFMLKANVQESATIKPVVVKRKKKDNTEEKQA